MDRLIIVHAFTVQSIVLPFHWVNGLSILDRFASFLLTGFNYLA